MRSEASSLHASEPVVSLITWRPQAWERRLSLRVDSRSQRSRCFQRRDVCWSHQQTGEFCADPFLRYRQCGSCRQARALDAATLRLACQRGGGTVENFDRNGCAHGTREAGRRRRCIASCAEQRTGEATYARGRKCENTLELRGRAPADSPDQAKHGALRAAGAREVGLCPEDRAHWTKGDCVKGAMGCTQSTR